MSSERLDFCDSLRGVAVLLVVVSHFVGVFWVSQKGLSSLMGYTPLSADLSLPYADLIIGNRLILGELGVALFFLISGFVIPFSLTRFNGIGFLINRMVRIYPVYIAGFLILIAGLYMVDSQGDGIPYGRQHLFVHSFIVVRQWLGYARIDGISWTLEIELYFYIIMFFIFHANENKRILLFIVALFILGFVSYVLGSYNKWYVGRQVSMIGYMLLGVFFYYYHIKKLNLSVVLVLTVTELAVLLNFFINTDFFKGEHLMWFVGYLLAPIIFFITYLLRDHIHSQAIAKFFGLISYPLYAVHALFGYAVLYTLLNNNVRPWWAVFVTFLIVVSVSYLIHRLVEKPSIVLSRKYNR